MRRKVLARPEGGGGVVLGQSNYGAWARRVITSPESWKYATWSPGERNLEAELKASKAREAGYRKLLQSSGSCSKQLADCRSRLASCQRKPVQYARPAPSPAAPSVSYAPATASSPVAWAAASPVAYSMPMSGFSSSQKVLLKLLVGGVVFFYLIKGIQ